MGEDERDGDPGEAGEPQRTARESVGGVIAKAIGVLVVLVSIGLVLGVAYMTKGGELDADAFVAGVFRDGRIPFGLELRDATRLATGETLVTLEPPASESAAPDAEAPGATASETNPDQIVLVEYATQKAAVELFEGKSKAQQFGAPSEDEDDSGRGASARLIEWERDPSDAWHTTLRRDEIGWSRWRAKYRIERSFREGGTWRDSVRVNLCQPERNLLLFAQWPVGVAADEDGVGRVVRTVQMLDPEAR